MYEDNKRLYWIQIEKENATGWNSGSNQVQDENREILKEKKAFKQRWKEHFKELIKL